MISRRDWFPGTIIHDCWPPYLALEAVEHGLCNAHLLRELQAIIDHDKEPWAADMNDLLSDALTLTQIAHDQGKPAVSPEQAHQIHQRFDACCDQAIKFHEGLATACTSDEDREARASETTDRT